MPQHPDVRKNVMTFSKRAVYLGAFWHGVLVGVVGWIEYKNTIKLKAEFVFPLYRGKKIYARLCEERHTILKKKDKTIFANCTTSALPWHLRNGAVIIKEYKHPSYKIKYNE